MRLAAWMLVSSGAVPMAYAELTWAQKTVELHASPDDTVLEARYRFSNDGTTPVDIRDVQSSCGCTTVALAQRHYDPGQGGEIVARFTVGERVGILKKAILVSTMDQPVATSLTLVVHIPEILRLVPPSLIWQPGEVLTAKTIEINVSPDGPPAEEMTALSSNPAMKAELRPTSDGRKYEISVTPPATDRTSFTTLTIHCRVGTLSKTLHAFVSVQRPMPPIVTTPPVTKRAPAPPALSSMD